MTTYYVGSGGSDSNDGLTWANRFLTLNGAEDEPVVANDTVYVGPGVYREQLTCDISGSSGQPITYIADVTGENTDGVGGVVRITGSDDDQTHNRTYCIVTASVDYRTFRGFSLDTADTLIFGDTCDNWIVEGCVFQAGGTGRCIRNANGLDWTVRKCAFIVVGTIGIWLESASAVDDSGHVVENCLFTGGGASDYVYIGGFGDAIIRNCTFLGGGGHGIYHYVSPNTSHPAIVSNCLFVANENAGVRGTLTADLTEDYNTFYANQTDRNQVNVGTNSETYPPLVDLPILLNGFKFPWRFGELSEWSQVAAIAGSGEATDDFFGLARPTTSAKKSWGAIQFTDSERETGTTRNSSVASMVLHDAGRIQLYVPVTAVSHTISVWVYREGDYAGTNPQLVIKQPGQSDDTTVDAAAASQWNLLTTTLTPGANPPYVIVELVSNNTAAATNFDVFFDDLRVR